VAKSSTAFDPLTRTIKRDYLTAAWAAGADSSE